MVLLSKIQIFKKFTRLITPWLKSRLSKIQNFKKFTRLITPWLKSRVLGILAMVVKSSNYGIIFKPVSKPIFSVSV